MALHLERITFIYLCNRNRFCASNESVKDLNFCGKVVVNYERLSGNFPVKTRINYFRLMGCFHGSQVMRLAWIVSSVYENIIEVGVGRCVYYRWGEGRFAVEAVGGEAWLDC